MYTNYNFVYGSNNNPTLFNDFQSCQLEGYKQSQKIIERADPINVNENKIYIKFGCVETPKKEV